MPVYLSAKMNTGMPVNTATVDSASQFFRLCEVIWSLKMTYFLDINMTLVIYGLTHWFIFGGTLNLGLICKMHCIKTVSLAPPYGQSQKFPNVK